MPTYTSTHHFYDSHDYDGYYTWFAAHPLWTPYTADKDLTYSSMQHLLSHISDIYYSDLVYDYLAAVSGCPSMTLPGTLQHLPRKAYKLTPAGAAFASHGPDELDAGGLTPQCLREMTDYLDALENQDDLYDFLTAIQHVAAPLVWEKREMWYLNPVSYTVTDAGAAWHHNYLGPVPALPYGAKECGMPDACLAALEEYYNDLAAEELRYVHDVKVAERPENDFLRSTYVAKYPVSSAVDEVLTAEKCGMPLKCAEAVDVYLYCLKVAEGIYFDAVAQFETHGSVPWYDADYSLEVHTDFEDIYDEEEEEENEEEDLEMLAPVCRVDPQEFVGELEEVDISTIPPEDMKCFHCWNNFGETDVDTVELRAGEIKADNSPVKLPCDHGHLIGKTCLMQLIDADVHLCPKCRVDIVAIV